MKFVNLLKSRLIFNILLFLNVCKQTVHMSHVSIFQKVKVVFHIFSYEDEDTSRFSNLH